MPNAPTLAETMLSLMLKGQLAEARDIVAANLEAEKNNPEFVFMAARVAREGRDLLAARRMLNHLLSMVGDNASVHELGYKIAYDESNLEAAMQHIAAGARLQPPSLFLKQLALCFVAGTNLGDGWPERLCQELLAIPQPAESHWRSALILAGAKEYGTAIVFMQAALQALKTYPHNAVHADALANDIYAINQLRRGNAISFPGHEDPEWLAMKARMAPCPTMSLGGPAATVILTSHFSNKLTTNKHKAPPNTQLLQETLASFRQHAKLPADWPIIITFDAPAEPQPAEESAYLKALEPIAAANNATIRTYRGAGLRQVFLDVFKDIQTPYFMILEHDWLCARDVEPLPLLAEVMNKYPFVNHIRYPRHHNHLNETDWHLMPEPRITELQLMATPSYSNNPCLCRTAKFARDWLPVVLAGSSFDQLNGGAGGLEENIIARSFHSMRRWGVYANAAADGTYLLGHPNDEPRIIHTGI